jgi:CHAD domain-containing protein
MANVTAIVPQNAAQQHRNRRSAPKPGDGAAVVHPVAQLHERITRLDAAMVVCRAIPGKEPVHSLRKATRYVEAQLALLDLIPGLPSHTAEADKVRKRLRSVRRAAKSVRDFDVQRRLVKDDEPAKDTKGKSAGKNGSANGKNTQAGGKKQGKKNSPEAELRSEAQALAKYLKRQRDQDADKLTDLLDSEEQRLARALRQLETALESAEERTVPADRLATDIQRWFHAHTPRLAASHDGKDPIQSLDEDALHTLRKTSKLCRYMAEALPESFPTAQQLTSRYEEIQESGGQWHDWMLLRDIAVTRQGKRAALPQRYAEHRDQALARYQSHLADLLPTNGARATEQPSAQVGEPTRRRAVHRQGPRASSRSGASTASPQPLELASSTRQ